MGRGRRQEKEEAEKEREKERERRPWRGTGGLALWNALKGREQFSWLELLVGCGAKREKAKEEERLSGTVLLQLITTLSSGRPALDVLPW